MRMSRILHCYAEGRQGEWEAICLDLDIAVQGHSFEDVYDSLKRAIALYLETGDALPERERAGLLDRPAPLAVRWKFFARAAQFLVRDSRNGKYQHQFTIPAAA